MYLSPQEIVELTGFKHRKKQVTHLTKQGIPFIVDRFGNPKVMYSSLENMGLSVRARRPTEPNFDALDKRHRSH